MSTLYVTLQGSRLEKEYKRLLVTKHDEIVMRIPIQRVSEVVLVGRVGVTTPALYSLLNNGVSFLLVSRTGKLRGRLQPPTDLNLPLRQKQFQLNDSPDFSLELSRQIVHGKIHNQRIYALRLARQQEQIIESHEKKLCELIKKTMEASSIEELMGLEGSAARTYFSVYRMGFKPIWKFENSNRRPPRDPINALLSLGYTFLGHAIFSALEVVGLDPYLGYFHAEKYGRPALVLDLIEEFRVPIVDSLIFSMINREMFKPDDFEYPTATKNVVLSSKGLGIFLSQFSQKLETPIAVRSIGRSLTYRKIFELQARNLANTIQGKTPQYIPFRMR